MLFIVCLVVTHVSLVGRGSSLCMSVCKGKTKTNTTSSVYKTYHLLSRHNSSANLMSSLVIVLRLRATETEHVCVTWSQTCSGWHIYWHPQTSPWWNFPLPLEWPGRHPSWTGNHELASLILWRRHSSICFDCKGDDILFDTLVLIHVFMFLSMTWEEANNTTENTLVWRIMSFLLRSSSHSISCHHRLILMWINDPMDVPPAWQAFGMLPCWWASRRIFDACWCPMTPSFSIKLLFFIR
jgi:hypothetical protein